MNPSQTEAIRPIEEEADESFKRSAACEVCGTEKGVMASSRFVDRFHDISLTLLIDRKTANILDAEVVMTRVPYAICRETIPLVKNLCGLSIYHRAVKREALKRMPRREGCTHLLELVEFTLAALFSGAPLAGLRGSKSPPGIQGEDPEEHRKRQLSNPWLKNTCRAFKDF